nr:hypothetical protein CFP56_71929 [Quercus suber]
MHQVKPSAVKTRLLAVREPFIWASAWHGMVSKQARRVSEYRVFTCRCNADIDHVADRTESDIPQLTNTRRKSRLAATAASDSFVTNASKQWWLASLSSVCDRHVFKTTSFWEISGFTPVARD